MYDFQAHFVDNILNEPDLIVFCTQLNDFSYFYDSVYY